MKVLLIGGTGCLSTDVSRKIVSDNQFELYLLNRGNRKKAFRVSRKKTCSTDASTLYYY